MQAPDILSVHQVGRDDMGHKSYQRYEVGPRRFSTPVECEVYRKREINSLSRFIEAISVFYPIVPTIGFVDKKMLNGR
jgi:hypothetical protein